MNFALKWIKATETQLSGATLSSENEDVISDLYDLCSDNPDDALEVILQVIALAPEERVLNQLGAGPIESLFFNYPEYLEKLISLTANTDALKNCLSHVNYDDEGSLDVNFLEKFLHNH
ncbi:MAG: hypothetical protein CTY16_16375 [Methylobacter sp.]|nr:MAG: hypothetical protein CTY16_16375 [Methylobacter sp.]